MVDSFEKSINQELVSWIVLLGQANHTSSDNLCANYWLLPRNAPPLAENCKSASQYIGSLHFISEQDIPKGQNRLTKKQITKEIRCTYWKIIAERTLVQQFGNHAMVKSWYGLIQRCHTALRFKAENSDLEANLLKRRKARSYQTSGKQ